MRKGGASIPTHAPTQALALSGPYRFSRNLIYLSMILLRLGISLCTNSLWFLLLAVLSGVLLFWGVIAREERYLARKFSADYLTSRVRRWL